MSQRKISVGDDLRLREAQKMLNQKDLEIKRLNNLVLKLNNEIVELSNQHILGRPTKMGNHAGILREQLVSEKALTGRLKGQISILEYKLDSTSENQIILKESQLEQ